MCLSKVQQYSIGFFSMFKNEHIHGKTLIHDGGRYFLRCDRALSVLGAVQLHSKAQPPSEKTLDNDEATRQTSKN